MPEKISPSHCIDYAELERAGIAPSLPQTGKDGHPALAASLSSHTAAQEKTAVFVAAQLWQLNRIVQSIHANNPDSILHAKRTRRVNGQDGCAKIVEIVVLYARPRPEGRIASFFHNIWYSKEQDLAAQVLSTLSVAGKVQGAVPAAAHAGLNMLAGQKKAPKMILHIKWCRGHLQKISDAIAMDRLAMTEVLSEKGSAVRKRIRSEFSSREENCNLPDEAKALLGSAERCDTHHEFLPYDFVDREIQAFQQLVEDIRSKRDSSTDAEVILDFCIRWAAHYEGSLPFKELVHGSDKYRAWNVVAQYVAYRKHDFIKQEAGAVSSPLPFHKQDYPQPAKVRAVQPLDQEVENIWTGQASKFRLADYTEYDRVLAPPRQDWAPLAMIGEQESTLFAAALHRQVGADDSFHSQQGIREGQLLFAARSVDIAPEQAALTADQEKHLRLAYRNFIEESVTSDTSFVLTPLFNYTVQTIDACIACMLAPLELGLRLKQPLPKVVIFTTDERVRRKFDAKLDTLQRQARHEQTMLVTQGGEPAVQAQDGGEGPAAPGSQITVTLPADPVNLRTEPLLQQRPPVAIASAASAAARNGIDSVKLQAGITSMDWNEAGLIMLTQSAGEYGASDIIGKFLANAAEGAKFPDAPSAIALVTRPRTNPERIRPQYFAAAAKVRLNSWWSPRNESLSAQAKADIAVTYNTIISAAIREKAERLVLAPCFDMADDTEARRQAIVEMFSTLDILLNMHGTLKVTLAARSRDDKRVLEEQLLTWKRNKKGSIPPAISV